MADLGAPMRRRLALTALAVILGTGAAACGPFVPSPPGTTVYLESARSEYWLAMGRCEQPGDGYGGVEWTIHGPTYEGGLGFYVSTWDHWRDATMPDNAGDASPAQQMLVADRVYDAVGASAWGCSRVVGLRP